MLISELQPEQEITIHVRIGENTLTFPSKVLAPLPKKSAVLGAVVMKDNRPVSFSGTGVIVDILVTFQDDKPLLFKNVSVKLLKKKENEYCYYMHSILDGVAYNRRGSFRSYVGIRTTVQLGLNTAPVDATIKDISVSGFSVICDNSPKLNPGIVIHTVLTDQPTPNGVVYNFHLYGLIARIQELDNGRLLIGCRINNPVVGIDKYIMEKERVRLRNTPGR